MYGPPVDRDRPDVFGADDDEQVDGYDEDVHDPGGRTVLRAATAPEALGLGALVLAFVSVLGIGLLNGMQYVPPSYDQGPAAQQSGLVAAALVGVGLALLPLGLGAWALRRLPEASPARTTAGAAVVVAAVSVGLRLVIAVRAGVDDSSGFFVQY